LKLKLYLPALLACGRSANSIVEIILLFRSTLRMRFLLAKPRLQVSDFFNA